MRVVTIRGRALVACVGLVAAACAAIRINAQTVDGDLPVQSAAVAWAKGYLYENESAILLDETIVVCDEGTRLWCLNRTIVDSASNDMLDPKVADDLKRDFLARNRAPSRVPPSRPFATLPVRSSARPFWPAGSRTFNGCTRVLSTL